MADSLEPPPSALIITVSDGVHAGTREDASGPAAAGILASAGFDVRPVEVVPDERSAIEGALRRGIEGSSLVVTTGGTGLAPRDVTPEATRVVIERDAPGLAEAMRAAGLQHHPRAALSRGVAGAAGSSLILNLPGSPAAVEESLAAVIPILQHAVRLVAGLPAHHPTNDA